MKWIIVETAEVITLLSLEVIVQTPSTNAMIVAVRLRPNGKRKRKIIMVVM